MDMRNNFIEALKKQYTRFIVKNNILSLLSII